MERYAPIVRYSGGGEDWLRNSWLVVVYMRNKEDQPAVDELARTFESRVGVGQRSFPVCSCRVSQGIRDKGSIFTNAPQLGSLFANEDCGCKAAGTDKKWWTSISEVVFRRLVRDDIHSNCKTERNSLQVAYTPIVAELAQVIKPGRKRNDIGEKLVGSATTPQRPLGIANCHVHEANPGVEGEQGIQGAAIGSHAPFAMLEPPTSGHVGPGQIGGDFPGGQTMFALPHVADSHPILVQKDGGGSATVAQDIALDVGFSRSFCKGGDCIGSRGGVVDISGTAPQQKLIVWADSRQEVYPTDSVVRHQDERKAREEQLANEDLIQEEIKKFRKK